MDTNRIIKQWLNDLAFSVATWNLGAHMDLVSENVKVLGIPGIDAIDYAGWLKRRRNEFNKKLLHSLLHRDVTLLQQRPRLITFSVKEQMRDHSKQCIEVEKEITLHQEEDGVWRVIRELILSINTKDYCTSA